MIKKLNDSTLSYYLCGILIVLVTNFLFDIQPWLNQIHRNIGYKPGSPFMPADSYTFWRFSNLVPLNQVPINVLGPTLVGFVFKSSYYLIFTFNLALLLFSVKEFANAIGIKKTIIFSAIFTNPAIIMQVNYINKEIYIICATLFFITYMLTRSKIHLFIFLLLCASTKLEFILIMSLVFLVLNIPKKYGIALTIFMLIIISVGYNHIPGMESKLGVLTANSQKSSLSYFLYKLNSKYHLFFLTFIPHSAHTVLTGVITFMKSPINLSLTFPWLVSGVLLVFLITANFIKAYKNRYFSKWHSCILIWFISTATIPFHVHRYILPIYIFLVAAYFTNSPSSDFNRLDKNK